MDYNDFVESIKDKVIDIYCSTGENVVVSVEKVIKNNGIELTGLNVIKDNARVSPTIYLNEYYTDDVDEAYLEKTAQKINKVYDARREYASCLAESYMDNYGDYEKVRDRIFYRLVNFDMNKDKLADIPYLPFNDLAITFRYMAYRDEEGIASSLISNDDLERWNINISMLYKTARENTERFFPAVIKKMTTLLQEQRILPENNIIKELNESDSNIMYIMSNTECINGATVVLYEGILEKCAELAGDNIYIMPSSVHELIFVGASTVDEPDVLKETVKDANNYVVHNTEVLSYNIYYYDRLEKTLRIV
jgi:hypothetical protein